MHQINKNKEEKIVLTDIVQILLLKRGEIYW